MRVGFYNISLDLLDHQEVLEKCEGYLDSGSCHTLFFLNAHCFNIAQRIPEYAASLNESSLLLNDGIGIKLASIAARIPLKENLNGTDLIPRILALAAKRGEKVFFLGGKEDVAAHAASKIRMVLPDLRIVGCHSGYFGNDDEAELIETINSSGASIIVLGLGVPKQELWAVRNRNKFPHARIIIGGGAVLDFISGNVSRAPVWIRKVNMEWAYRLYLEPSRLWKRYTTGIILFFYHVVRLWPQRRAPFRPIP